MKIKENVFDLTEKKKAEEENPTELFAIGELPNPPIVVSELYTIERL